MEPFGASHKGQPAAQGGGDATAQVAHGGAGVFFAWLADTDDRDIAAALRREVPPPVLFMLTRVGGRRDRLGLALCT